MKKGRLALIVLMIAALGCAPETQVTVGPYTEPVVLTMFNCWNQEVSVPQNPLDNAVVNVIRERIGVTVVMEGTAMDEEEQLRLILASGDMPDILNAPFWSGNNGTTALIKQAAIDGRLLALDEAIAPYENLKDAWKEGVVARPYLENDLEDPRFKGRHYILPTETPGNENNVTNWCYGIFARSDIVEALGVDPRSIRTPDDLYHFLGRVRDGGFTDTEGNPVIPASTSHDGWDKDSFCTGFNQRNMTQFRAAPDGGCTLYVLTESWVQKQMFLRRLLQEHLLDPECFKQSNARAWEKVSNGSVGVFALQYGELIEAAQKTGLYATHPETRYIPLGPLTYSDGVQTRVQPELNGRNGAPCSVFPVSCKNLDRALAFFDFCNSEEGLRLISYGIEGKDYLLEDGKPRLRPSDLERLQSGDPQWTRERVNRGIGVYPQRVVLADKRMDWFGEVNPGDSGSPAGQALRSYAELSPIQEFDGYPLDKLILDYPELEAVETLTPTGDNEAAVVEKAYFADSDAQAETLLRDYQRMLLELDGGILREFLDYTGELAASRDDVVW